MSASGLGLATGLFTVVPVPPVAEIGRVDAARALRWFPVVGLGLGLAAALVALGVRAAGGAPLLGAALAVATWALLTGGLHLDGLADTADGLASRREPARALAIMRASDIGPAGVGALVLVVLIDVAALSDALASSWWVAPAALVVAPALGRVAVLDAARRGVPGAHASGFGALFADLLGPGEVAAAALGVLAVAAGLGAAVGGALTAVGWVATAVVALVAARFWQRHVVRRVGGVTGDVFGSLVELTQAVFLVGASLTF